MHPSIVAAGIAALACAAAAAPDPVETATVTMTKGYDKGSGFASATVQQIFLLGKNASCDRKKRLAIFNWMTGTSTTKPIPAGAPVNIYADVERVNALDHGVCQNNVIFTPIAGHSYTLVQRSAVWQSCHIEVIDTATNQPPEDLRQDNSVECIETYKP